VTRWVVSAAVLAGTTFAVLVGFNRELYRDAYAFTSATTVEYHAGASHALAETDAVIVSSKRSRYTVSLGTDPSIVLPRTRNELSVTYDEGSTTFQSVHERPWTYDAYRIVSVVPLSFNANVIPSGGSFEVFLENDSDALLMGGVFIYRGMLYRVGPFAPGQTITQSSAAVGTSLAEAYDEADSIDRVERTGLTQLLNEERWRSMQEAGAVFFVGWFTEPPIDLHPTRDFRIVTDASMIVIVVETEGNSDV